MKYINSYIIITLHESKIYELSHWLESAHAAFALDIRENRIIIFNISGSFLVRLLSLYPLTDWIYSKGYTPEEYVELFKHVNYCLEQNLMAYKRCFSKDPVVDTEWIGTKEFEMLKRAFGTDNYREWRRRFYLTRDIRAIDAQTLGYTPLEYDDEYLTASGLIVGRARQYWQYPDYYPDAYITASLRIDPDKKKAMIGWFIDNDHFMEYNVDHEALSLLSNRMKSWFSEMNITNNAHNPEEVNNILRVFDIDQYGCLHRSNRDVNKPDRTLNKFRHINNFITIDYTTLPHSLISRVLNGYAHAYDYENDRIIIFNLDVASLRFILGQKGIIKIAYSPRNGIVEYGNLFDFVDRQIEINKKHPQSTGHYLSRANAYIRHQMNLANLKGFDAKRLPNIE